MNLKSEKFLTFETGGGNLLTNRKRTINSYFFKTTLQQVEKNAAAWFFLQKHS